MTDLAARTGEEDLHVRRIIDRAWSCGKQEGSPRGLTAIARVYRLQCPVQSRDLVAPGVCESEIHSNPEVASAKDALPREWLALRLADECKERRSDLGPEHLVGGDHIEVAANGVTWGLQADMLLDELSGILVGDAGGRQALP
ncbi:MAG: hypothetical protein E6J90_52475 [Deltaproteobacteria bacterium]|nr:MAG: hypothetical protein E6J90_52475 [Deltaproteobacteria bacterium]